MLIIFFPMTPHTLFLSEQATPQSHIGHQTVYYYFSVPWEKLFLCLLQRTKKFNKEKKNPTQYIKLVEINNHIKRILS